MKVNNISFTSKSIPVKSLITRSLVDNRFILGKDIWKDVDSYRALTGLSTRRLKKAEQNTFVNLPNIEVKKMFLKQILKVK